MRYSKLLRVFGTLVVLAALCPSRATSRSAPAKPDPHYVCYVVVPTPGGTTVGKINYREIVSRARLDHVAFYNELDQPVTFTAVKVNLGQGGVSSGNLWPFTGNNSKFTVQPHNRVQFQLHDGSGGDKGPLTFIFDTQPKIAVDPGPGEPGVTVED